jgi:hypothetical protein
MNIFVQGRWQQWQLMVKDAALNCIGWAMNKAHSPARLKPFEYVDPDTDETIYLYTDKRLSVLCIGEHRYYFDRITGRFDGTLSGMVNVAGGIELAD